MAKAYSVDLRERAIKFYEQTKSMSKTCKLFSITERTLYRWLELKRKTGKVEPRQQSHVGHNHAIKTYEYEEFENFLETNVGLDLEELAKRWGRGMSKSSMCRWIKKFGFTRKKTRRLS